jgi:hypothetical protein
VSGLQFVAAIVNSVAWPATVVVAVVLLREELVGAFHRVQSFEFAGGKATFAALPDYEKMIAAAAKDAGTPDDKAIVREEVSEFSVVDALVPAAPGQAVIGAWGILEYQLNVASDQIAADQPHGWPQVAHNLETWDKWPIFYPAVLELRRLRDYTVRSRRPPSVEDAARYVSVAKDLAATVRSSFMSHDYLRSGSGA